jgi:hypothetical protein
MRKYILIIVIFILCCVLFLMTIVIGWRLITNQRAIHKAAWKGNLEKVKNIIEKKPEQINVQDIHGKTPLYYASSQGHPEIVTFLLDHGADIELANSLGERPLTKAVIFNHYSTVKILLEHGAMVNYKDKYCGTPLHAALLSKDITDMLLSYGADVSARDKTNDTPLHIAAMQNNLQAAKTLIEHGADVFAKNDYDPAALRRAAAKGDEDAKWDLRIYESTKNIKNKTPKEMALRLGYKELAQYLQTKEDEKKSAVPVK